MEFGLIFRKLRKHQNLQINQLAKRAHVDPSTISKLERGVRKPKPATLQKLAQGLNISYGHLLGMAGVIDEDDLPQNVIVPKGYARIPIVGSIPCGDPNTAIRETDNYKLVPSDEPHEHYIFLKADGHSMEPKVQDGSLVKIHLQPDVENLSIAAISINDGDCTLKQVIKHNNRVVRFHPLNPKFGDIYPDANNDCRIIGKATEVENKL